MSVYGLDPGELKALVIGPTLTALGVVKVGAALIPLDSPSARSLLLGTGLVESELAHLRQLGGGPALGLYQMEPATAKDIWVNYLTYQPDLATAVRHLMSGQDPLEQLVTNLAYATAMARIKYLRSPLPLPGPADAAGMAALHKQVYNTASGAANEAENVPVFQRAILA